MSEMQSMSDSQKIFHIGMLFFFGAIGLIGIGMLAIGYGLTSDQGAVTGPTVIWGPPFKGDMHILFTELAHRDDVFTQTSYVVKHPDTMYGELIEALSVGRGPDAVIVDPRFLLPLMEKVRPIPYEWLPLADFRRTYVEGAEIFALNNGIYAYPLVVDPLVLYWNRRLFTNALVAQVPEDWDSVVATVPELTIYQAGQGSTIKQAALSFGEYENVSHAKEILSALLFQTGVSIVTETPGGFRPDLDIAQQGEERRSDAERALQFYVDFSNPIKTVYTWNKTFERSLEAFAANKLAMYPGFIGEADLIREINPNLNFDISMWPQSVTGDNAVTYGRFYGVAILQGSRNPLSALAVARGLADPRHADLWTKHTGLPSVRRDFLAEDPKDPHSRTMIRSALIARDWLQPDPRAIDELFARVVEGIVSGRTGLGLSITNTYWDMNALLDKYTYD